MASLYSEMKNYLRGQRIEVEKLVEEFEKVKEDLKDNRLDEKYKQSVLIPKYGEIRHKISEKKTAIDLEAKRMTEVVKQNIHKLNDIKGEDLTDDAKLFSCGVKLTESDLEKIIDRNSGNPTMTQLALRYANENGLKVQRVLDTHSAELQACDDIYGAASLYVKNWIDHPDDSYKLLEKFFPDEG